QEESGREKSAPLIACYGLGREVMPVYEPRCAPAEKKSDLENLLDQARSEHRPLYVTYGYDSFNRAKLPDGFTLLDDRSKFEELKAFAGIEPEFYFPVLTAK